MIITQDLRDKLRAAISDAYYDGRDLGKTMEESADDALAAVVSVLAPEDNKYCYAFTADPNWCVAHKAAYPKNSLFCEKTPDRSKTEIKTIPFYY